MADETGQFRNRQRALNGTYRGGCTADQGVGNTELSPLHPYASLKF